MAYTRAYLLAKWSSGATKRAFRVKMDGYRPGTSHPKQMARNLDGDVQEARGTSKSQIAGTIFIDEDDDGSTIEYDAVTYDLAQLADLEAMYEATDLQVKRFGDSAFFDAVTVGDLVWSVMDVVGTFSIAEVKIIEA